MDKEKILELAAQNETDTFSERVWAFDEEALLAFVRAVVEAERETRKLTYDDIKDVLKKHIYRVDMFAFARDIERRINGEEE